VAAAKQTPAVGSAMFGAVAAGSSAGGYDSIYAAAKNMAHLREHEVYRPNPAAHAVYNRLFTEYMQLHDYFGRGVNDVMKRVKSLKAEVLLNKGS
jgi:L-ribulokinase